MLRMQTRNAMSFEDSRIELPVLGLDPTAEIPAILSRQILDTGATSAATSTKPFPPSAAASFSNFSHVFESVEAAAGLSPETNGGDFWGKRWRHRVPSASLNDVHIRSLSQSYSDDAPGLLINGSDPTKQGYQSVQGISSYGDCGAGVAGSGLSELVLLKRAAGKNFSPVNGPSFRLHPPPL